jgi:hypothetical protein
MIQGRTFSSGNDVNGDTWYVDNYVLLKNYYDMTVSRIAARCVRSGNIAIEEYKHYDYILDVLEEISETGDYIVNHPDLYAYVDKKIAGGIQALKNNLNQFKIELEQNASPEMIKQDAEELNKMKQTLGEIDKSIDPTAGAGMSADEIVNKLLQNNSSSQESQINQSSVRPSAPVQPSQAQPQPARPSAPTQTYQQTQDMSGDRINSSDMLDINHNSSPQG